MVCAYLECLSPFPRKYIYFKRIWVYLAHERNVKIMKICSSFVAANVADVHELGPFGQLTQFLNENIYSFKIKKLPVATIMLV